MEQTDDFFNRRTCSAQHLVLDNTEYQRSKEKPYCLKGDGNSCFVSEFRANKIRFTFNSSSSTSYMIRRFEETASYAVDNGLHLVL